MWTPVVGIDYKLAVEAEVEEQAELMDIEVCLKIWVRRNCNRS